MVDDLQVRAVSAPWWNGVEFLLRWRKHDGLYLARPVEYSPVDNGIGAIVEPTFRLSMDEAQALMDDLWKCGIRPTEGTGSAGSLAATQAHLKDMQRIAFDLLGRTKQE